MLLKLKSAIKSDYKKANLNWAKLKYYKHLPDDNIVREHTLFGGKVYYAKASELLHGLQEIFIAEVYKQNLPHNSIIFDCGANIGLSAIYLKKISPNSIIHAFEPDENNYNLLCKNIESFGLLNVLAHKKAIWTKNTILDFSSDGSMGSKIATTQPNNKTIQVESIRLSDLIENKIDFLKLDIEGAEYEVLKDIQSKLYLIDRLFIEYHGSFKEQSNLSEILLMLTNNEFTYYIKEATNIYEHPYLALLAQKKPNYDIQLNIFAFRLKKN